jgi:hypothetical protein
MNYNIIDQPFLPVLMLDGTRKEIGLLEAFTEAHNIQDIEGENPIIIASLNRLLIAVGFAICRPKNSAEVNQIRQQGKFQKQDVKNYFSRWHNRFDLYDKDYPFYQVSDKYVKQALGNLSPPKPWSVSKMMSVDKNTPSLFSHCMETDEVSFTPPEACRRLIGYQTFSPAGNPQGKPFVFVAGPVPKIASGTIYVIRGKNLFETIVQNMNLHSKGMEENDMPCWEKETLEPAVSQANGGTSPTGPLDLLTWQNRWVQLIPDGEVFKRMLVLQGYVVDKSAQDPMAEYFTNKDGEKYAKRFDLVRGWWQNYHTLVANIDQEKVQRPLTIQRLQRGDCFSIDVFAVVFDKHVAKTIAIRHESWPLPSQWVDNNEIYECLKSITKYVDKCWYALKDGFKAFADNLLSAHKARRRLTDGLIDQLGVDFWSQLEQEFRLLINAIEQKQSFHGCDATDLGNYRTAWRSMVRKLTLNTYHYVLQGFNSPEEIRAYARGMISIHRGIKWKNKKPQN